MNFFTVAKFAMLSAAMPQPAASAQMFATLPVSAIGRTGETEVSPELMAKFTDELAAGKSAVESLTDQANAFYLKLLELSNDSTDKARSALEGQDLSEYEACEMFMRAFEITLKKVADDSNLPSFVSSEMNAYWRKVAKARSIVTKVNNYVKQLTQDAVTFESDIDLQGLRYLADYTTEKLGSKSFH